LHYVYALAKAGRSKWVKKILVSMGENARSVNPFVRNRWLEVAIGSPCSRRPPYCCSTIATRSGALDRDRCSHAQRALFEQIDYQDALFNCSP
jgi:hypothetical protein